MYVHDKVNIFPANRLTFFRKVPFAVRASTAFFEKTREMTKFADFKN